MRLSDHVANWGVRAPHNPVVRVTMRGGEIDPGSAELTDGKRPARDDQGDYDLDAFCAWWGIDGYDDLEAAPGDWTEFIRQWMAD
jgi:hypothetical protein